MQPRDPDDRTPFIRINGIDFTPDAGQYRTWVSGGFDQCPVCRGYWHASHCPMRGLMSLAWTGTAPDERAGE